MDALREEGCILVGRALNFSQSVSYEKASELCNFRCIVRRLFKEYTAAGSAAADFCHN